ncbi:rod shape-determining protein RodA [Clostridium argentinense CDC 2741]|uniref:Peptidoglycan glycosyltransferase RodA n=1 Tax=Clostridium argentinense CDC 2741 TaxID=1418104 RepID=A0A0C1R169_9CLOT|nr:rod shape-determining protein RodA [Clostridium argentinense]ARC85573.1 rod shape-determining protein RodA [Clostridium argentinense]KIE47132.1 rod shape-determining protein RodA [Clostridium argentinense CDC 2741]NFF40088.1 rod shape-determining protein RodA [Clostridium argentinense]NFP50212.1 rod shape-determining protein RodA [Clostridium argentinense]NFP74853.1 rod shape-determining protein RodA [Clostridium argentinense]
MLKNLKLNDKLIKRIDYGIIIAVVLIVLFSIANIYSAIGGYYAKLQFAWLIVGLVTMYFVILIDYTLILNYAPLIYWGGVVLLILTEFVLGSEVNGATGWISIGSRALQPSEFAKIGMILMLAKQIQDMDGDVNNVKSVVKLGIYAAIPMLLIVIAPDMGMTMVCFFMVLGIVVVTNLNWKAIVGGLGGIFLAVVALWNSPLMKPYWKSRFVAFLNPEQFELSHGLQLLQSKIAIGSGGVFGLGFLNGKQYKFVPENHTDFIFAVIGEEWGLVGALILLTLYGIILYKSIKIAKTSKDVAGSIICTGIIGALMFSIIQNMGMTMGVMPITGITLPFVSYGGSSMLTNFISLGLILNVGIRRKKINF